MASVRASLGERVKGDCAMRFEVFPVAPGPGEDQNDPAVAVFSSFALAP
jgi:hypothetical protein